MHKFRKTTTFFGIPPLPSPFAGAGAGGAREDGAISVGGRIGVRRAASGAFRGIAAGADLACGLSFRRSEDDLSTAILSVGGAFLAGCGGAGRIFPSENPFGITFARFGARDGSVGRPDRKNKIENEIII